MSSDFEDFINDKNPDPRREAEILRYRIGIINQMSTREGRRFVNGILGLTGINSNANCVGTNQTFFKLGMQNVGQLLQIDLDQQCPELYFTMLKEAKEDYDRERAEHSNASE